MGKKRRKLGTLGSTRRRQEAAIELVPIRPWPRAFTQPGISHFTWCLPRGLAFRTSLLTTNNHVYLRILAGARLSLNRGGCDLGQGSGTWWAARDLRKQPYSRRFYRLLRITHPYTYSQICRLVSAEHRKGISPALSDRCTPRAYGGCGRCTSGDVQCWGGREEEVVVIRQGAYTRGGRRTSGDVHCLGGGGRCTLWRVHCV